MTISAQRFSMLDRETQIGSANFSSLRDSAIQNITDNAVKLIPNSLTNLIGSASQKITSVKSDFSNIFKEIERKTMTGIGSVLDFTTLDVSKLGDFTNLISGGKSDVSRSLKDVLTKCTRNGNGLGYGGRSYRPSVNCSNGKTNVGYGGGYIGCNASSYNDILGKLGGADAMKTLFDKAKALSAFLSLSNHGYSLGMCGVFGALMNGTNFTSLGLDKTEYSKAAGVLMNTLGSNQNTRGWIDVASASIVGDLNPLHFSPSAVGDLVNNFTLPEQLSERGLLSLATSSLESIEGVDPDWTSLDFDEASMDDLTIADYTDITSDGQDAFGSFLQNRAYDEDQLDVIPSSDMDFSLGGLMAC